MSGDPFDEVPSTWLTPRAAVHLIVRQLNVDPGEAARALTAAVMRGEVPHRLKGEVILMPFGCDYSLDIPASGRSGRRLVVKVWGFVETDWVQGTVSDLPIQVHGPTLVAWMLKEASVLRSLARNAAAPGVSDSSDAGASRGREPGHPAGGAAMEAGGAAPGSEPEMRSGVVDPRSGHRRPFDFDDAKAQMIGKRILWEKNGRKAWAPTIAEIEAWVEANYAGRWKREDLRQLANVWPKECRPTGPRPKHAPPRRPNSAEPLGGQPRKP